MTLLVTITLLFLGPVILPPATLPGSGCSRPATSARRAAPPQHPPGAVRAGDRAALGRRGGAGGPVVRDALAGRQARPVAGALSPAPELSGLPAGLVSGSPLFRLVHAAPVCGP